MSFTSICTSKGKVDSGYFAVIRTPASLSPSISPSSAFKINFAAFFLPSKESVAEDAPSIGEDSSEEDSGEDASGAAGSVAVGFVEDTAFEETSAGEFPVTALSIGELSVEGASNELVSVEAVSLAEAFSKEIASF